MSSSTADAGAVVRLKVQKLSCDSCVSRAERALSAREGVLDASVNLATGEARVTVDHSGRIGDRTSILNYCSWEPGETPHLGKSPLQLQGLDVDGGVRALGAAVG